jgi:hypothetical protein
VPERALISEIFLTRQPFAAKPHGPRFDDSAPIAMPCQLVAAAEHTTHARATPDNLGAQRTLRL